MQAGSLTFQHIFEKDVLHCVPLFQRPYVWNQEDQWEPLWNDIKQLATKILNGEQYKDHFLGASVHAIPKVGPGQIETRTLIDGQQRFATVQLFLKAFQNVVSSTGFSKYESAITKLTHNDHPLSRTAHEAFKVWPTNADRDDFRRTMEAGSPEALCAQLGYGKRVDNLGRPISDAYLYFHAAINAWLKPETDDAEKRIATLYSAIREHVRMVIIDLDERDDAQIIFETLNARGTPLLAADLVKNALIQRAQQNRHLNVDDLYERYWDHFDSVQWYWRSLIGPGHARRPRIEIYLQHFLALRLKREIRADRLYPIYRDFMDSEAAGSVEDCFSSIARYGEIFRRIDNLEVGDLRAKLSLGRLATMDVGTAYPFLLELFSRLKGHDDSLVICLADVESFLVRRMVCSLSTRGYNALFIDLINRLNGSEDGIPSRVRSALKSRSADANRWPDDTEFYNAWMNQELYRSLKRDRLRMLLEALERASRSKKTEPEILESRLHIEHVMPREWRENWPLPRKRPTVEASLERDHVIHTIGNLTLLTHSLNSSVSNGPWLTTRGRCKRAAIAEHSVLRLNKDIVKAKRWSESAISSRAEKLFKLAVSIWAYP